MGKLRHVAALSVSWIMAEPSFADNSQQLLSESIGASRLPADISNWEGIWCGRWDEVWPVFFYVDSIAATDEEGAYEANVRYVWKENLARDFREIEFNNVPLRSGYIDLDFIDLSRDTPTDQTAHAYGYFETPRNASVIQVRKGGSVNEKPSNVICPSFPIRTDILPIHPRVFAMMVWHGRAAT